MFHLSPCFVVILSLFSHYSLLVDATQETQARRRTQSTSLATISCNGDKDCSYANQKCALSSAEASATKICCQSTIFFAYESPFDHIDESEYNRLDLDDEEEESEAPTPTPWYRTYAHLINQSVCADQPPGALCVYSNDLCTSGVCGADETCQEDKLPTLASCSDDADCDGGACGAPTVRDLAPRTVFAALLAALSSRFAPINQRVPSAVERILYALRTTATTVFVWQTRFMLAVATEDIATTIASAPQAFAFKASVSREEVPPEDPAIPIRTVSMASVA